MLSVAIPETRPPRLPGQPIKTISLRDNALWYPDIPKSHLHLNEAFLKEQKNALYGFRPLCCMLGDATDTTSLSKIVVVQDGNRTPPHPVAISCYYHTGDVQGLAHHNRYIYCPRTSSHLVQRVAGEVTDTITFVKEPDPSRVSSYSKCLSHIIRRIAC
jgi:hypothetical protein